MNKIYYGMNCPCVLLITVFKSFVFCHAPHEGTSERMKAFFTVRMKIGEAKRRADNIMIILFEPNRYYVCNIHSIKFVNDCYSGCTVQVKSYQNLMIHTYNHKISYRFTVLLNCK